MEIHGKNWIGMRLSADDCKGVCAVNPVTGKTLEGEFVPATTDELNQALTLAQTAFVAYRKLSPFLRAGFLEAIADEILALGPALIERATKETALPEARLIGERGRTIGQLNAFSQLLREGSWVDAVIDLAQPAREPIPRPDVRRMLQPIGPVGVFAASNFPLAFSVAGGDTASALAGGNPVIVKAHSGHPGTSELIAGALIAAAQKTGMPDGIFSMLHGSGQTVGQALVKHPALKAVGFTGSTYAGRTLFDIANKRPEPIPVFAEMGSINPVLITPGALADRGSEIASLYAGSITLGTGQFCTNPGLIIGLDSEGLTRFIAALAKSISSILPTTMLNPDVYSGFVQSLDKILSQEGIQPDGASLKTPASDRHEARPTVASVAGKLFLSNPHYRAEVFGPFSLVVKCADKTELLAVVDSLEGQLTATVMAQESEFKVFSDIIDILEQRSGRILFNGVPTGVEVCAAMQHGGPYPASTDARFSSVGTSAVKRFMRPVAYQDWPQTALPDALKNENPLDIWRLVDNQLTKDKIIP